MQIEIFKAKVEERNHKKNEVREWNWDGAIVLTNQPALFPSHGYVPANLFDSGLAFYSMAQWDC